MNYRLIYILILSTLMMGCSNDFTPELPTAREQGPILIGGVRTATGLGWHNGRTIGRADNEIESDTPDDIGVFAFGDGPNTTYIFRNQQVLNFGEKTYTADPFKWDYWGNTQETQISDWPYTTEKGASVQRPWEKMKYKFFAYSPWYETKDVSVSSENYDNFNSFTWDNVPGFSEKDYILSNYIVAHDNTKGEFVTKVPIVEFSMRHILSRLRFFFKMSEGYRKIRRFELNSLTVLTAGKVKTATFNFKDQEWDTHVHWSNEKIGSAEPVILTSVNGTTYDIPTEYGTEPFASVYVYPQENFEEVKMLLDYTVYDSEGVEMRRSTLTNSVTLPKWTLLAGYYYDIRINIVPDYLYVLSDHDQTLDGYVIVEDK